MDKFQVVLSRNASEDLDSFSDRVCEKIVLAMQILRDNPFPRGKLIKKIQGTKSNYYRLRADKYRVFCMLEENRAVILRILSKKDVERFIRNLN